MSGTKFSPQSSFRARHGTRNRKWYNKAKRRRPSIMKGGVISILFCLVEIILPLVYGQVDVCDTTLASASVEFGTTNVRRSDVLLNIAHGIGRSAKCTFLNTVLVRTGLRGDCGERLSATCPVQASEAAVSTFRFDAPFGGIPTDCPTEIPECDVSIPYRSIDGSCNNLWNPRWGQTGSQERRLLGQNAYDDGQGSPRTRACNGGTLPSARTVSNMIHSAGSTLVFEPELSLLVMQMGQFLVHDLVLTKVFFREDGFPLQCCTVDRNHPECNPIDIPEGDPVFQSCMNFARSNASLDCSSIRQVINSQSSYFDLSTVYGSTNSEAATLRSFIGGRMKVVQNKLPIDFADSTCVLSRPFDPMNYYCPLAGDVRVIEQPGLASMHTIFVREHNRLAEGLAIMNPFWDDERLYQEARKINIGQWQNIIYSEFLPAILGRDVINRFNLNVPRFGYNDNYRTSVDATISNAFAVAVFRYGHSQVHNVIGMSNSFHQQSTDPLERHFFEPDWYHAGNGSGLENILHWTTSTGCPFTDRKIQDSIRQKLFLDDNGDSLDLATLNIHRGRDHGTPGYTAFRTFCGLSPVYHFGTRRGGLIDHDLDAARLLQQTYACPSDIDLFTGLLTERRTRGSVLGPTWQCLLASEFRRLRDGDRFFFERRDPQNPGIGFTQYQLNSIKMVTTSDIICRNTNTRFMQSNAFLRPSRGSGRQHSNRLRNCNTFRGVNLRLWRERQLP